MVIEADLGRPSCDKSLRLWHNLTIHFSNRILIWYHRGLSTLTKYHLNATGLQKLFHHSDICSIMQSIKRQYKVLLRMYTGILDLVKSGQCWQKLLWYSTPGMRALESFRQIILDQCTEVCFASFPSGEFITVIVVQLRGN